MITVSILVQAFKESAPRNYFEVDDPVPNCPMELQSDNACAVIDGCWNLNDVVRRINEFTALDRIEVKGDEHERNTTGSGTTTEE